MCKINEIKEIKIVWKVDMEMMKFKLVDCIQAESKMWKINEEMKKKKLLEIDKRVSEWSLRYWSVRGVDEIRENLKKLKIMVKFTVLEFI